MFLQSRKDLLFLTLAAFFITNAVVAELIGGKLINIGPFTLSIGIIPWPVVFLTTDLINEYFGKKGVTRLSLITSAMIAYAFVLLFAAINVPASPISPVDAGSFQIVFGQSMWIIVGSITAFLVSQLVDVAVFWFLRAKTGKAFIWVRSTGSTVVSQLIDSFIVLGIAFYLPGAISFSQYIDLSFTNYSAKLIIAVALTPLIYMGHGIVRRYLGEKEAEHMVEATAEKIL